MSASHNDGSDDSEAGRIDAEQSETRMRQALDRLSGDRFGGATKMPQPGSQSSFSSAGPRRHRYVQDGEVPVVQISSLRDRRRDAATPTPQSAPQEPAADAVRQALAQERGARLRAEQALERLQAAFHALETRLGHAEITQREAVEQAHTREGAAARLQSELNEQSGLLKAAQTQAHEALRRQRELELELEEARLGLDVEPSLVPEPPPLRPRKLDRVARHRPTVEELMAGSDLLPTAQADEPEPVKWWLTPVPVARAKQRRAR